MTHYPTIDYAASGELGPIQHVSGGRLRRHVTLANGTYAGAIYAQSAAPIGPDSNKVARNSPYSVFFDAVPYERNHKNRDLTAWGEHVRLEVSRYTCDAELGDYELWNMAAARLYAASDSLTLAYGRHPAHYERGPWQVGYVGNAGKDTVWAECNRLSAGIIPCSIGSPAHFNAVNKDTVLRIVARWEPLTMGGCERRLAIMKVNGPPVSVPKHVKNWIETRLR